LNAKGAGEKSSRMEDVLYYLVEMSLRSPHVPHVMPKRYYDLKIRLEAMATMGTNWIETEEVTRIMEEVGGSADDVEDALNVLQDKGVLLYFSKRISKVILKPSWLFAVLTNVRKYFL
jgi:hypothetical protein